MDKLYKDGLDYPVSEHPGYWDCNENGHEIRKIECLDGEYEYWKCLYCGRCEDDPEGFLPKCTGCCELCKECKTPCIF